MGTINDSEFKRKSTEAERKLHSVRKDIANVEGQLKTLEERHTVQEQQEIQAAADQGIEVADFEPSQALLSLSDTINRTREKLESLRNSESEAIGVMEFLRQSQLETELVEESRRTEKYKKLAAELADELEKVRAKIAQSESRREKLAEEIVAHSKEQDGKKG